MKKATMLLSAALILAPSTLLAQWTTYAGPVIAPTVLCNPVGMGINVIPGSVQTLSNACPGRIFGLVGQNRQAVAALSCGVEGFSQNTLVANTNECIGTWGFTEHSGTGLAYGARGYAKSFNTTAGTAFGVYGEAIISNCGVPGTGTPPTNVAIGLYGIATAPSCGTANSWALYANGKTFTPGAAWTASDARLKTNIADVKSALGIVRNLHAKTYSFRKDGQYQHTGLPAGNQIGFLAQDIEKVLPELVTDAPLFFTDTQDGRSNPRSENIKAINYTGLIPVLTQAINELKDEVDALRAELATLKSKKADDGKAVAGQLLQNNPNPFSQSTTIRYNLPVDVKQATLLIFDMQGKQVKQAALSNRGNGSYLLQGSELTAGMYLYTLMADGKEIETRRMILTKD
jgi:Chaperone of endosialidase/Secretion system C-terminal sorting domain